MRDKSIILILFVICMFMQHILHAQQWQWAKKGGSVVDVCDGCVGNSQEEIKSMYTDKGGNTYTFGVMGWQGKFDTFTPQANLLIGSNYAMYFLAKTSCSGIVEWVKYFGGGAFESINMFNMLVDEEMDRIYLNVRLSHTLIISGDTAYTGVLGAYPSGLLIFNLNGQRQELRIINTESHEAALGDFKMDKDKNIYARAFCYSDTFQVFPGISIYPYRNYIFKLDRDFNYIDHYDTKVRATGSSIAISNVYYELAHENRIFLYTSAGGSDSLFVGDSLYTTTISGGISVLLECDSLMNHVHQYITRPYTSTGGGGISIASFNHGSFNIIQVARQSIFQGDTIINRKTPIQATINVCKSTKTFNIINKLESSSKNYLTSFSLANTQKNRYAISIASIDTATISGGIDFNIRNFRWATFIEYDTNLNVLNIPPILLFENASPAPSIELMNYDKNNNIIIAGQYRDHVFLSNDTLTSSGGYNDIYLAKYGVASCTPCIPLGAWIDSSYNLQLYCSNQSEFVDSTFWNFGDGTTSSSFNANHTYTASGIYTVCMYAFGSCGIDTVCKSIGITGISSTTNELPLLVYPNPANDKITLQYSTQSDVSIEIIDLQGKTVYSSKNPLGINQKIVLDISKLSNGLYTILVKDSTSQGVKKLSVVR